MSAADTLETHASATSTASVAAIRAALANLQAALTQSILLGQRPGIKDEPLLEAACKEGLVAKASAAFLAARDELNRILQRQVHEAQVEVDAIAWPYLTHLFGAQMPGKVTLASDCGLRPITELVVGLESLHERNGEVSGIVRTLSDNGRCRDTRSFFTRGNTVFFAGHVSL
jgi:hypothetical protein